MKTLRRSALIASFAALALAACATMTLNVSGWSEDGSESFTGTATGYMDPAGALHVTTSRGISCIGDFVFVNSREGRGTFRCSDGRTGPFTFVANGMYGEGTGRLGNTRVRFTIG